MSQEPGQSQGVWVTGQGGGQRAGRLSSTPRPASAVEGEGESRDKRQANRAERTERGGETRPGDGFRNKGGAN